ncbi:MAG: ABC transporter ATP-binding protein [Pseudomonadota bacterium]
MDGAADRSDAFAISVQGLRKTYGSGEGAKEALKGVDLTVARGSIFGLLGPNGAGKSTFINILAGLVNKSGGEARIWGFDIDKNPRQARASIGVVPQEISVDVFFTPKEALELQAGLYGVPRSERRTDEILEALDLAEKSKAYVRHLSGGMKRRLLIGKALVHNPPVLILDEPTAGVDIELRRKLWSYVRELNARGVTIVLTTHYLEEAQELCDTIAIIDKGDVVASRPKSELLASLDRKELLVSPEARLVKAPNIDPFTATIRQDGRIAVSYAPSRTNVGEILTRLSEAGVVICDLTTEEASLEDVFLEMTYHRDAPADGGRAA